MATPKGSPSSGPGKGPKSNNTKSDLIDDDISFEERDMHKTWPLVKGCLMLFVGVAIFIWISAFVFKQFAGWF